MQIALLVYEARVQGYRRLKAIDEIIDKNPTPALVKEFTELRILNNLCFRELETFNNTGKWLYKHPLIVHHSERVRLTQLKATNPEAFFKEYSLCKQNIARYSSYIKSDKRTVDQKKADLNHLRKHEDRDVLFSEILKS